MGALSSSDSTLSQGAAAIVTHLIMLRWSSLNLADVMVQEFIKCGALDLFLKREGSVSVSWKLDVAKQLASALNFLVR